MPENLAPVFNRDGSTRFGADGLPMIVDWREPLIANGRMWIAAGTLPDAETVTPDDLKKLELDSPFKRLGPDQSADDLAYTKAREVLIVTSDDKLILLQRGPWAASTGQLQSTGGGFTGVVDGQRAQSIAETLETQLEQKHKVRIDTNDLLDLECTTIGGGITTYHGIKDGKREVGGTAEILESYIVRTKLSSQDFLAQMQPSRAVVGVVIMDLDEIDTIANKKFIAVNYVRNAPLYDALFVQIEKPDKNLSLAEVFDQIDALSQGPKPSSEQLKERGKCDPATMKIAIVNVDKLFHPRTKPVLYAVAEAMGFDLAPQAKTDLAAFRASLKAERTGLDKAIAALKAQENGPIIQALEGYYPDK